MMNRTLVIGTKLRSSFFNSLVTNIRKMSTEEPDVIFQEIGNKGVIILNRPKALNSLNLSMVKKLYPTLKKWESEKSLVLVKGAGGKAFCAGGDVKAIVQAAISGESKLGQEFFKYEYTTNGLIGSYKVPYIALIDGIVMGGGVGLSVHGKYRIATEKTLFAMPETQIGLFPDVGGSYFLSRLDGKLGWYLALTGFRLKGIDVLAAGIATHFCPSSEVPTLEKRILECSDENELNNTLESYSKVDKDKFVLSPYLNKINECFSAPSVEEIFAKLENDGSKWAQDTLQTLKKMSPTSLKITIKELEIGKELTLKECLQMEYRLAVSCVDNHDFREGVRALLIDKDQNPKWVPSTIQEVSDQTVNKYFAKLSDSQELKHKL